MFAAGGVRVVVASSALAAEDALAGVMDDLGDRVPVGIEVANGRIRSRGRGGVDLDLMSASGGSPRPGHAASWSRRSPGWAPARAPTWM